MPNETVIKYAACLAIVGAISSRDAHVYRVRDGQLLTRLDEAINGLIADTAVIGRAALREAQADYSAPALYRWQQEKLAEIRQNGATQ